MKIQLQQGTDKKTFKNQAIRRAFLDVIYSYDDTLLANTGLDLSQINITLDVQQGGIKKSSSFQALPAFAVYNVYDCKAVASMQRFQPGVAEFKSTTINIDGFIVTNVARIPIFLDAFNLKATDEMTITVQTLSGSAGSANTSTQYYLNIEAGTDLNQESMIIPRYEIVTDSNTNPQFNSESCTRLVLVGGSATSYSAVSPFTGATVRSRFYNDEYDGAGISELVIYNEVYDVNPVFVLFDSRDGSIVLENLVLNLNVDTTKITDGGDWVHFKEMVPNPVVLGRAVERANRIAKSKLNLLTK